MGHFCFRPFELIKRSDFAIFSCFVPANLNQLSREADQPVDGLS